MLEFFLESIGKYYGLDWAGMTLSFLQLYTLGNKLRIGFLLGMTASACWLGFGLLAGSTAGMIANGVFVSMNIVGYLKWGRTQAAAQ